MDFVNSQEDIYHLTYKVLSERFQYFLQDLTRPNEAKQHGIIVCDHRGAQDDKRLRDHHQMLLYSTSNFVTRYTHLIESVFLQPSHQSVGIQLADMVAGAVWRKFERNDSVFFDLISASFRKSKAGRLEGYGLVKVPKQGWV